MQETTLPSVPIEQLQTEEEEQQQQQEGHEEEEEEEQTSTCARFSHLGTRLRSWNWAEGGLGLEGSGGSREEGRGEELMESGMDGGNGCSRRGEKGKLVR